MRLLQVEVKTNMANNKQQNTNGKIVQIIGPVVDVKFALTSLPEIFSALTVNSLTLEVQQHLGEGVVRTVALGSTDGLKRGMEVVDTKAPISVPVGEKVLGRMFNVVGEPIDGLGAVHAAKKYPIHRPAPSFTEQEATPKVLETGIKVLDLIAPFLNGGKV